VESSNNLIEGNRIGTDTTGTADAGNGFVGVWVHGESVAAANNTIRKNLISGNGNHGVYIDGALASGNYVEGNYIGTDVAGYDALGNGAQGVGIFDSASNWIGGTTVAQRNVISGNWGDGIWIGGSATGNMVQGNYVGTDAAGTGWLSNVGSGIYVEASGNTIGIQPLKSAGSCVPPCNLVSANSYSGIYIQGDNNTVEGNYVGTDVFGTGNLGNMGWGIVVVGSGNMIGGLSTWGGNRVAFNWFGVVIQGATPHAQYINAEVAKGLAIGADAYVTKPFSTKELVQKVREMLEARS